MNLKPGFFIIFSLLLFSCLITFYLNYQSYELFKQTKYTKLEIAHLETIVSKIKNAAPAIHPVSTNGTFLSAYNDGKEAENYFSIFKYTTQSFENNKLKMTDNPEYLAPLSITEMYKIRRRLVKMQVLVYIYADPVKCKIDSGLNDKFY